MLLVAVACLLGCESNSRRAARLAQERNELDQWVPPGTPRSQIVAKMGNEDLKHIVLPSEKLDETSADANFIRWCIGDCVVRGDHPVASLDHLLTVREVFGLYANVILYDREDRVIRAYRRFLD